jgi:glycosyltransferase involved in cell wall biosynthesis
VLEPVRVDVVARNRIGFMRYLFVHRSMPGQFGHLAAYLARRGDEVVFLTQSGGPPPAGTRAIRYKRAREPVAQTHRYLQSTETAVLNAQGVARACDALKKSGFVPDAILAHPGWGEGLYIKDVLPKTRLVNYCEFFFRSEGADVDYYPDEPVDLDLACRLRTRNAILLLALDAADQGISPTHWQRSVHPPEYQSKIEVVFDGIDIDRVRPDPAATLTLPGGRRLSCGDPVVTYVARDLEPYRGFPNFVRALPRVLAAAPTTDVVIVGGDEVSYGRRPPSGNSWREYLAGEVPLDPARVHFLGPVDYETYLRVLQVSAVHVYLTVPFVLGWSAMEALAAGCLMVGSDTAPVAEVIEHGKNGFLVDLRSPEAIAEQVLDALANRSAYARMRDSARSTIVGRYDLATTLPRLEALLRGPS